MIPAILDRTHYVRALRQPASPGWNPTTHLARIHFPRGGEQDAYFKLDPQFNAFAGNEAIGWIIARRLGIAAPEESALLIEDAAWFKEKLGIRYPTGQPGFPDTGLLAAWCCTDLGAPPIRSVAPFDDWNLLAFLRTEDGARIAALDVWLANIDRNNGNLLRLRQGRYAVIDHGLLFGYQDWRRGPIHPDNPGFLWTKAQEHFRDKRLTRREYNDLRSGMGEFGQTHHRVAGELHPVIDAFISELEDPQAAKSVLSCIAERCGHRRVSDEVGLLI